MSVIIASAGLKRIAGRALVAAALTAAGLMPRPGLAAETGPSFDCAKAGSAVERALCADPDLGRLDRTIAKRYGVLQKSLSAPERAALKDDQKWFLQARDNAYQMSSPGSRNKDLKETMSYRARFLDAVVAEAAGGLAGRWRNVAGEVEIKAGANGAFDVTINSAEPSSGRWVCDIAGKGRVEGGVLRIVSDAADDWRIAVVQRGAMIEVTEVSPNGQPQSSPFCGMNGSVAGSYFHQSGLE